MGNDLLIKVCGMKYQANRHDLEELPIDILGFIFYRPSPRDVSILEPADLARLTETQRFKAGVFVNEETAVILRHSELAGLTHVQLHGEETPLRCRELRESGLKIIKAFRMADDFDFSVTSIFSEVADYFLFDTRAEQRGGTGLKFNWQILHNYKGRVPFFLSGGIGPSDVEAVRQFGHPMLCGIDLNSGFEDGPGLKNKEKLRVFLEQIK
jgi:phosphoribosylanthranilate isomerase